MPKVLVLWQIYIASPAASTKDHLSNHAAVEANERQAQPDRPAKYMPHT